MTLARTGARGREMTPPQTPESSWRFIKAKRRWRDKDTLLSRLAASLGVDYDDILRRRVLHLMPLSEAGELAPRGVDLQLHTHRHRVSSRQAVFDREIRENQALLRTLRSSEATHFCYPGGVHRAEFLPWLRGSHIASATTCAPGMASRHHDRLLLPLHRHGRSDGRRVPRVAHGHRDVPAHTPPGRDGRPVRRGARRVLSLTRDRPRPSWSRCNARAPPTPARARSRIP
jgi:peptidoglycan/xylan/chitin deacetylase (PgdA/CDA1 family)